MTATTFSAPTSATKPTVAPATALELCFPAEQYTGPIAFPNHDWIISLKPGSTISIPESACNFDEGGARIMRPIEVLADVEIRTGDGQHIRFDGLPVQLPVGGQFQAPTPLSILEQASIRRAAA